MSSFAMKMMRFMMGFQGGFKMVEKADGSLDFPKFRQVSDDSMLALKPQKGVTFREAALGKMPGELCEPASVKGDCILFYIHGGGFFAGNAQTSRAFASMLAVLMSERVYSCSYRLAPEHPAPDMQEDCFSGYAALSTQYPDTPIVLIGESGGAHLSIVTALLARERGLRPPACVVAYSTPLAWDGSLNEQRKAYEKSDIQLSVKALDVLANAFCPDPGMRTDRIVSPCYADFTGFPPLFAAWAKNEVLAPDSELLVSLCQRAGVTVEARPMPDAFHAYPTLGAMLPEAKTTLNETAAFIRRYTKKNA